MSGSCDEMETAETDRVNPSALTSSGATFMVLVTNSAWHGAGSSYSLVPHRTLDMLLI